MKLVLKRIAKLAKLVVSTGEIKYRGENMLPANELPTDIQHRIDNFINDRMQDNLSRKDALEVLANYVELKTGEKMKGSQLKSWMYESTAIPVAKLSAITKSFSE